MNPNLKYFAADWKVILIPLTILILLLLFLCGCNNRVIESPSSLDITYHIKVIDGCQYIFSDRGLAHKGNCTNRIHVYAAEEPKDWRK